MRILNGFVCPECGVDFPFFVASARIRGGLFSFPLLKCRHCGAISRETISWVNALWAWPLAFLLLGGVIWVLRTTSFFTDLRHSSPLLYGVVSGVIIGLVIGINLRLSLKLVRAQTGHKRN